MSSLFLRWFPRLAVAALALFTLTATGGLGSDEFDCEEAVAHLADCCPGFETSRIACFTTGGGCGYQNQPQLVASERACLRALDCNTIRNRGLCQTLQRLPAQSHTCPPPGAPDDGSARNSCPDGSVSRPLVCP